MSSKSSIGLNGHRESNDLVEAVTSMMSIEALRASVLSTAAERAVLTTSPEVVAPLKRRRRTSAFKLRIIAEADACEHRGDLGALLRREGVYHSDLANWRKQKGQGLLTGAPVSRSQRSNAALRSDPLYQEALKLQTELARENRELRRQLGRAKQVIEVQKKVALLLGETLQDVSLDEIGEIDDEGS